MRKLLSTTIFAIAAAAALTACGGSSAPATTAAPAATAAPETTAAAETKAEETKAEETKAEETKAEETKAEETTEEEVGMMDDVAYIQQKGSLIVGITDFAPMDYKNDKGEWIGFDADVAKKVAESLGVEIEFIEIDWDNKILELQNKSIDVVWNGMTLTDEVANAMECSKPYCNNAQVVVLKKEDADKYPDVASLKDLQFAVEAGSAGEAAAEENGFSFTSITTQADTLMEISAGTSDASIIDLLMAGAMVGEGTSYADLTHTLELTTEEYVVGCRKDSDLASYIDDQLKKMSEDGSLMEIARIRRPGRCCHPVNRIRPPAGTALSPEALLTFKEFPCSQPLLSLLLEDFGGTLKRFVLTLLFALPLGLVISFGSTSKVSFIRVPIRFLIWAGVIRGTPPMLQLLVVYYGPGIIFGNNIWGSRDTGRFLAALLSFVINYPAISRRSSAAGSSPSRWDSMRQDRSSA